MTDSDLKQMYDNYDPLAIAILMIDIVISKMAPYSGISEKELFKSVTPFFKKMDQVHEIEDIDKTKYREIFDKILNLLTLQSEKGKYKETYTDYSQNPPVRRKKSSRILQYKSFNRVVLYATKETVNIFLQLLDINISDQQKANNLIIKRQIDRGEFTKALEVAKRNFTLTKHYSIRLEEIIQGTKRDQSKLDWDDEIPSLLKNAKGHIDDVIKDIRTQKERLASLQNSTYDKYKFKTLKKLINIINRTLSELLPLQTKIYDANEEFLKNQWVYILHEKIENRINLEEDFFQKLLRKTIRFSKQNMEELVPFFSKPKEPVLITYDQIIHKLFRSLDIKKKQKTKPISIIANEDIEKIRLKKFEEELIEKVEKYFESFLESHNKFTLNDLIEDSKKKGQAFDFQNYLRIKLQIDLISESNIDEGIIKKNGLKYKVSITKKESANYYLNNDVFYGNNLTIKKV